MPLLLSPLSPGSPLGRLRAAGEIDPAAEDLDDLPGPLLAMELRSLDAIHLSSAERIGADLAAIVTYDERMVAAAGLLGLKALSPA